MQVSRTRRRAVRARGPIAGRGWRLRLRSAFALATAGFIAGLYYALMFEPGERLRLLVEAGYVWIVVFLVPYLLFERTARLAWHGLAVLTRGGRTS